LAAVMRHSPLSAPIGRLIRGVAAGNNGFEHHLFGYPFERRMGRFVDGCL
jgi:hypothetical protein